MNRTFFNRQQILAMGFVCLLILSFSYHAQAKVSVVSMFADHMVLQRQMSVPVWG